MTQTTTLAKISPVALARPAEQQPPEVEPLRVGIRGKTWIGACFVLLFFGAGGGWAALAPLSGAVLAPGVVSPEGRNRIVQHLEGGIIEKLYVSEGGKVSKGQILIVLSDVKAQAGVNTSSINLINLAAREARLRAEAANKNEIAFDHPALQAKDDPVVRSVIAQQRAHFHTRRELATGRVELMSKRGSQLEEQIGGLQIQLDSSRRQLELTTTEVVIVAEMVKKGYERKPRLISLQSRAAELEGTIGRIISEIARVKEQISETEVTTQAMRALEMEKVEKELADIEAERRAVEESIKESMDQLKRTHITAPVSGTVINLQYKTLGGIIIPGRPIMEIVPEGDELIIEARVSPKDIDDVRVGQPARIVFPSYPQRNIKRINGVVDRVSADTFVDDKGGDPYYLARVHVDSAHLREVAPEIQLGPGLPADAFIQTVEHTVLDYLMAPVSRTLDRAFRER